MTEEEKEAAITAAREKKQAQLNLQAYMDKIRQPKKFVPLTTDQIFTWVMRTAKAEIDNFEVTREEENIYTLLAMYFADDPEFEKSGEYSLKKGILLAGSVGCGKTTIFRLFHLNPNQSFAIISCRRIANEYKEFGPSIVDKYSKYPAIGLDDLGTETTAKHFGNESNVMAEILYERYDREVSSRFRTFVTTNLRPSEIEAFYGSRVRSRAREMFNQIEFPENSKDKRK